MGEISVWVKGHEKQIGGVTHRTTSAEILKFALSEGVCATTEKARRSGRCYGLFENWRGCQRLIPPWKRIYKLWKLWGLERIHVKFVVKKVAMETLARKDFGEYVEVSRLKVPKRHVALRMEPHHEISETESEFTSSSDGVGLFLLDESDAEIGRPIPGTRRKRTLLNRVHRQSDQLREIGRTVLDVDEEILFYEAKLHHNRVVEGGKDYVQHAYMSEAGDSGVTRPRVASPGHIKSMGGGDADAKDERQNNDGTNDGTNPSGNLQVSNTKNVKESEIHEDIRKESSHCEVKLGSRRDDNPKSNTKILVVNPLPRCEISTTIENENEQDNLKNGEKDFIIPTGEVITPASHQNRAKHRSIWKHHRHGGKVKKRMPGLYEFEQNCEWLRVMDTELKRLESMENLSFVDWDSESLLSDKDLTFHGNRKFRFRTAVPARNMNTRTSDKMSKCEIIGKDLVESFSNVHLAKQSINKPSTKLYIKEKQIEEGAVEESPATDWYIEDAILKSEKSGSFISENSPTESGEMLQKETFSGNGNFGNSRDVTTHGNISKVESRPNCDVKKSDVVKPGDTLLARCAPAYEMKPAVIINTTRNNAPRKHPVNKSSKVTKHVSFSCDKTSSTHPTSDLSKVTTVMSAPTAPITRVPPALPRYTSTPEKPERINDVSKQNGATRGYSSFGVGKGGDGGTSTPVPQSSPMVVRMVPKPPIYFSTEGAGPVRHLPKEYQTVSRNNNHFGFKANTSHSNDILPDHSRSVIAQNVPALHPRVEQLRTAPVQNQIPPKRAAEMTSARKSLNENVPDAAKRTQPCVVGMVTGTLKPKEGTIEEGQYGLMVPKHSTPIKTPIPTTTGGLVVPTRVRSPDQGFGPELRTPGEKFKPGLIENELVNDSSSETGMGSVHSQDSGISNVSVVMETWV